MRRIRKIRDIVKILDKDFNYQTTYFKVRRLYDNNVIDGVRVENNVYLYLDEVIDILVKEEKKNEGRGKDGKQGL